MNRFRLYSQNLGGVNLMIWLLVLAYLVWAQFQYSSSLATWVMLVVLGLCLLAPLAIMPICERYPGRSAQIARWVQFVILGFVVLSWTNVVMIPWYAYLVFVGTVFLYFGWTFWFYSSPAVFTGRRVGGLHERYMAAEEAELVREVEANQQMLDEMDERENGR